MDIKDETGKTRKELMIIAIDKQMEKFKNQNINKKVAVVSFGSHVNVIGDNSRNNFIVNDVSDEYKIHE